MKAVEWNKKEDLLADQALRHLKTYASALQTFASSPKIELILLQKIQEYCYDNMNFMKLFQKIVMMLYKSKNVHTSCIHPEYIMYTPCMHLVYTLHTPCIHPLQGIFKLFRF